MVNKKDKIYELSVSILDADFTHLEDEIRKIEPYADFIQIDVMDGHFVPNISFGIPIVRAIKNITDIPLEAHLMIQEPQRYIKDFIDAGSNCVIIHYESESSIEILNIIKEIKEYGIEAGLAVNPDTPIMNITDYLKNIDILLVMSVFPGFGGQKFIKKTYDRIRKIRRIIDSEDIKVKVEVDGGVNLNNAHKLLKAGTDILVVGSAIYKSSDTEEAVKNFSLIEI